MSDLAEHWLKLPLVPYGRPSFAYRGLSMNLTVMSWSHVQRFTLENVGDRWLVGLEFESWLRQLTWSSTFIRRSSATILSECQLVLYHSIGLDELYNFAFECVVIWWSVWSETDENYWRERAILRERAPFLDFADEILTKSFSTQKTFDRAFQELSNGV